MFDPIKLLSKYIIREERLTNSDKEFPNSIMFYPILLLYKRRVREERYENCVKEWSNKINKN